MDAGELPSAPRLSVVVERGPDHVVVRVTGDVDMARAAEFATALDQEGPSLVVADLTGVAFFDSRAISALLTAARVTAGRGQSLRLVGPSEAVAEVLRLAGIDHAFQSFQTLAAALAGTSPQPGREGDPSC